MRKILNIFLVLALFLTLSLNSKEVDASSISLPNIGTLSGVSGKIVSSDFSYNDKKNDWESSWAKYTIKDFIEKGYVKGYPDGSFKPTKSINRSEFVTIFNRVFGLTTKNGNTFNDTKNHWAKDSIDIAVTNGVAKGVSRTEFAPDDPITREQAAKMVANYKKISDTNHDKLNGYSDGSNVSSWAKNEVEGILEKGYMNGYTDGSFKPKSKITRAEAVVTLDRSKNEKKTAFTWDIAVQYIINALGPEDEHFIYNGRTDVHLDDNGRRYCYVWKEKRNAPSIAEGTIATYYVYEDGTVIPY